MKRRQFLIWTGALVSAPHLQAAAPEQAYFTQVNQALDLLVKLGVPVAGADAKQIAALARRNDRQAVDTAERILNRYTLATVSSGSEPRIVPGAAPRILLEQGWKAFLVRVVNPKAQVETIALSTSRKPFPEGPGRIQPFPSAGWNDHHPPGSDPQLDGQEAASMIEDMWILSILSGTAPITRGGAEIPVITLSGLLVEYRVMQVFSRDPGKHTADLTLYSFPEANALPSILGYKQLDFNCLSARTVALEIQDADGQSCTASLTIKDQAGRVYPPPMMRVVPDRFFHDHIYRSDNESVRLPDGVYTVSSIRGAEYVPVEQTVKIDASHNRIAVRLQRWIDASQWGYYSGDLHMHANCCVPFRIPEGVTPETMIRELRGEGLAIAEVLAYGLGWTYQAQFFTQSARSPEASLEHPELQRANHTTLTPHAAKKDADSTLRYGIETSVFPAEHSGHLVMARLATLQYPGAGSTKDWPSWNLPILRWVREQGGIAGYGHSGAGLSTVSKELPNYEIPPFDSLGANEAFVDVTFGLLDHLGGCELDPVAELNIWYHLLNCGFRLAFLGESDYPGLTTDRPGVGLSYVRLSERPVGDAGYNRWMDALRRGRVYCGDGRSHFLNFRVNGHQNGEEDVMLETGGQVVIEALVAARLEPNASDYKPLAPIAAGWRNDWHLERARIGETRQVPVELVVNGRAVDKAILLADGKPQTLTFHTTITRSSWVALRIFPSGHTHPVFVQVANKPIRASKRSARWCRTCVDKTWTTTSPHIRENERAAAAEAYNHARKTYDAIIAECEID